MGTKQANSLKVLTIHSLAVHGSAGLKNTLSILGTRVLPIPSLILTGLTNMDKIIKTPVEFASLFMGSLELARIRNHKLILYVGYLGNSAQAEIIEMGIKQYNDIIHGVVIDPVSGDHGKAYVPEEIIQVWPRLLDLADYALPNITEIQLLTGYDPSLPSNQNQALTHFQQRFPKLTSIVTSLGGKEEMQIAICPKNGKNYRISHEKLPYNYGGSGDIFAASFIGNYFYGEKELKQSVESAAAQTLSFLKRAKALDSPDLVIEFENILHETK